MLRGTWTTDTTEPKLGVIGNVYEANEFSDPESAAFEAYVFYPDGSENGYYCSYEDFELITVLTDDSGSLALPYALIGLAAYMVYWMIAHGVFQALTALQGRR